MKVIFLDIDGVLNTESFIRAFWAIARRAKVDRIEAKAFRRAVLNDGYGNHFDPCACTQLQRIIEETGAKIVISSSWRHSGLEFMQNLWKHRELKGEVIDITGTFRDGSDMGFKERAERGHEIKMWLEKHPEVESYVIIDDDDDMLKEQEPFFVQTEQMYGITINDALKCIQILNS